MRSTRMRFGGVGAVVATGLLLAACSGTPTGPAEDNGGDGETSSEGTASGATEVTVWQQSFTDEENAWYKDLVDGYNASQSDVVVKLQVVPGDAWEQRMTAAQAAGNAPDIYTANYGDIADAARTSQIVSLADLISDAAWDDLQENVRDFVTVDGEEYAYPLLVEPSAVLYYRTDLFEAAGIDGPPTTWEELIADAEKLSTPEVFGVRLAQNAPDMSWSTWGYQLNAAGQYPISTDWSEPAATEAYAPLLQAFQDLFASGALPPADSVGYADATTFIDGKYAMMANGSWAASQILASDSGIAENVAVAAMPSFDGEAGKTTATLGGWTLVVDAKSDAPAEAAAFIEWALGGDPENVISFFEATAFSKVTARVSVGEAINAIPDIDSINPWNATIQSDIVPFAQAEPTYPWNISLAMGEAIEAAMQGTPVAEALATANAKIQTEIENSGLAGTGS